MTEMSVAQRMTAEEFLAMPVEEDVARRELLDGEIVVSQPTPLHVRVQSTLFGHLWSWAGAGPGRGEVLFPLDIGLDEHNVFVPDIIWWAEGHGPGPYERPSPMPDLAVEVRSPSTWACDIGPKKARYERHGLRELCLVDTAAYEVMAFHRSSRETQSFDRFTTFAGSDTLRSGLLEGFALPLSKLFER
ncbi:Uma2 family endonuclease [soil metagenome]